MNVLDLFKLDDRVAIVTGAGRGIGRALAHALAEAGAHVAVAELLKDNGERVVKEIQNIGKRAMSIQTDVSDYESVQKMVDAVYQEFGRIDILVNNAGVVYKPVGSGGASIPTENVSPDNWEHVIKINLCGVFYCAQLVGKIMIKQGSGSIVNIASMSAFVANLGRHNNAYCAAKGGVVMFTRQLAADWAKYGIRVNAIAPGYIRTEIGAGPLEDPELKDLIPRMTPMTRAGVPDDLKGSVVYLASAASRYLTGQTIIIDGGYTLW
jgi:NAD(P)-dependent dehydrogenase (short-subunit alcohol dehydrogenase family)